MESEQPTPSSSLIFRPFIKFKHPTTIIVAGPTQCGKTELIKNMLIHREEIFEKCPSNIMWAFGHLKENQMESIKNKVPETVFSNGLPTERESLSNSILILDDLMNEICKNQEYSNLFTRGSHHDNITTIAVLHNIYNKEKYNRNIALNTHYYVLFKNPRDKQQIRYLENQIFPGQKNHLLNAFNNATARPYGYLVIDLHPTTPENMRLYSNILPDDIHLLYN